MERQGFSPHGIYYLEVNNLWKQFSFNDVIMGRGSCQPVYEAPK